MYWHWELHEDGVASRVCTAGRKVPMESEKPILMTIKLPPRSGGPSNLAICGLTGSLAVIVNQTVWLYKYVFSILDEFRPYLFKSFNTWGVHVCINNFL